MHILHTFPMVEMENFKMWVSVLALWSLALLLEVFLLYHFKVNSKCKGSQFWKQTNHGQEWGCPCCLDKQNGILRKKPHCMVISKMKSYCSRFNSTLVRLPSRFKQQTYQSSYATHIVCLLSLQLGVVQNSKCCQRSPDDSCKWNSDSQILLLTLNSHGLPRQNSSLQYQNIIKQTSDKNKEKFIN